MSAVLDASAFLALLFDEPGAGTVRDVLPGAYMSSVNVCEALGRFTRSGVDPTAVLTTDIPALDVRTVPFDDTQALHSAALIPLTRQFGLSLGDRACLTLASLRQTPVLTADRAWTDLDLGVEVVLIR